MAKYSGIVDLKGTIGNMSFYKRKGVPCVRRPGGFTRERLLGDPRLRRVVEHNAEFGAQSMASRSLRTALSPLKNFCDGSLHNRLMAIAARVTSLTEPESEPLLDVDVDLTVGSHRYQQYVARIDRGGGPLERWRLPVAWHVGEARWIPMRAAFLTPDGTPATTS